MEIQEYVRPQTLDEAYRLIEERRGTPLGGTAWLRMYAKNVPLAIDLADLGLEYIREAEDGIEIGAMTTYRALETRSLLASRFGPLFGRCLGHIVGVQLRNIATVGGTIAGRYGFSDLNTTLCALGAKLVLFPGKVMDLAAFIANGVSGPFLIEKIILPASAKGAYQQMRISENDFPILNTAVAWTGTGWRIVVGSRPAASHLCNAAMALLGNTPSPSDETIAQAARTAADELQFGSDVRASAEYRKAILPVLVRRALMEVRA
ncbi:MAG: FAD binding domain-containing protein [Rectinema sp.]|nr:FAD binding domain-containing protein [Rectinema sp.]